MVSVPGLSNVQRVKIEASRKNAEKENLKQTCQAKPRQAKGKQDKSSAAVASRHKD